MRHQIRRITALILAMAMCLSLLSANVWAAESSQTTYDSGGAQCSMSVEKDDVSDEQSDDTDSLIGLSSTDEPVDYSRNEQVKQLNMDSGSEAIDCGELDTQGGGKSTTDEKSSVFDITSDGILVKYTGSGGEVVIPDNVTAINGCLFMDMDTLTSVTIPDSVCWIGMSAFRRCKNLQKVTLGENVQEIGENAFEDCAALKHIHIGTKLKAIYKEAFKGCSSLEDMDLPQGLDTIYSSTFQDCVSLREITIPGSVKTVRQNAFSGCSSLNTLRVENGVNSIQENAFAECVSLENVSLPNSLTMIRDHAFYKNTALLSIIVPNSVTYLGAGAFAYCSSLKTAVLSDGLKGVQTFLFAYCTSLMNCKLPSDAWYIGRSAFLECTSLTSLAIPVTMSDIEGFSLFCVPLQEINYEGTEKDWKKVRSNPGEIPKETVINYEVPFPRVSVQLELSGQSIRCRYSINKSDEVFYAFEPDSIDLKLLLSNSVPEGYSGDDTFYFDSADVTISDSFWGKFSDGSSSVSYVVLNGSEAVRANAGKILITDKFNPVFPEQKKYSLPEEQTVTLSYTIRGTQNGTKTVIQGSKNITIIFEEDFFIVGRDSNTFAHNEIDIKSLPKSDKEIGNTYPVSIPLFGQLCMNLTWDQQIALIDTMSATDKYGAYDWGGSCMGLTISMALANIGKLDVANFDKEAKAKNYSDLLVMNIPLRDQINYYQLLQSVSKITPTKQLFRPKKNKKLSDADWNDYWNSFFEAVKDGVKAKTPVLFNFGFKKNSGSDAGHSIIACGIDEDTYKDYTVVKLYDCNIVTSNTYLIVDKNKQSSYLTYDPENPKGKLVGLYFQDTLNSQSTWTYFEYYDKNKVQKIDAANDLVPSFQEAVSNQSGSSVSENYMVLETDGFAPFTLTDAEGEVFSFDGESYSDNMSHITTLFISTAPLKVQYLFPASSEYLFQNTAPGVTYRMTTDDSYSTVSANGASEFLLTPEKGVDIHGTDYDFSVGIALESDNALLRVSGQSTADCTFGITPEGTLDISSEGSISNASLTSLTAAEECSRSIEGTFQTLSGLTSADVKRDEPVLADSTPEPKPQPDLGPHPTAKQKNIITCKSAIAKTVNIVKNQTFKLKASANGAKLTYKSSSKSVTVKNGTVTIRKGFAGKANIKITAAETDTYFSATKKVTVSVKPAAAAKVDKKKKFVTVSWTKCSVGKGYEIQIALKKDFKKVVKKVQIKKKTTASTVVKGLKPGTYFVRVRVLNGKKNSDWSAVKSFKVAK